MIRVAFIASALAAVGAPAAAAERTVAAHVTIVEAMTVRMGWVMAMPTVRGGVAGATFAGVAPSAGMSRMVPGGATLVARTDDASPLPTAPTSFEVINRRGEDTLVVKTGGVSEVDIGADGAVLTGALAGGSAVSIRVARAGPDGASTGSNGALVVLVQYN